MECASTGASKSAHPSAASAIPNSLARTVGQGSRCARTAPPEHGRSPPRHNGYLHGQGRRARDPPNGFAGGSEQKKSPAAIEDRPRARRRGLHRRRLRDRCPAGPRPAGHQPHRQRVRRLRGHQRGLVRGQHGGERDHARGDDAGAEPRVALAAAGHHARHPAQTQLRRDRAQVAHLPAAGGGSGEGAGQPPERAVGGRRGDRSGQRLADRHLLGPRDRELCRGGALGPRSKQRLPAARLGAVPDRDRPRHDRARGDG